MAILRSIERQFDHYPFQMRPNPHLIGSRLSSLGARLLALPSRFTFHVSRFTFHVSPSHENTTQTNRHPH